MVESCANKITSFLICSKTIEEKEYDLYLYGFKTLIAFIVNIVVILFIAGAFKLTQGAISTIKNTSNNKKQTWTVDPEMQPKDIEKQVLINGEYKLNPTAKNINDYISDNTNYVKDKHFNGKFMYVIDKDGNIIIGDGNKDYYPHPTLIGGENPQVQSAGMVEIRGGKIYKIDNASGHFKPGAGSLDISQEFFEQLPEKVFSKDFKGYEDYGIKK